MIHHFHVAIFQQSLGGLKMSTLNSDQRIQRYGMVIGVKPEKIDEYKRLHADTWPGVLKMIGECNIRNYFLFRIYR